MSAVVMSLWSPRPILNETPLTHMSASLNLTTLSIQVEIMHQPTFMSAIMCSFVSLSSIFHRVMSLLEHKTGRMVGVLIDIAIARKFLNGRVDVQLSMINTGMTLNRAAAPASQMALNDDTDTRNSGGLNSSAGVIWVRDDFPLYGPLAMMLRSDEKDLIEHMVKNRYTVTDGVTIYVYCTIVASWSQLYSEVAANELLKITKINAPVNYAIALKWVYACLKRIAYPVGRMYPSVCIGTYRLMFHAETSSTGTIVHYRPHPVMIPNPTGNADVNRVYCFVKSPIIVPYPFSIPYEVVVDFEDIILNKVLAPLRDDQKLDFLWRIGKALTDPVSNQSVITFYGRDGHEGKTKLAEMLTMILTDAVEWVSEDLFGSESKWPDADKIMYLCTKRILICDECNIKDGYSYNNIKRWTSGAPISMSGRTGFLSQTSIVISNVLPFFDKGAVNNSIGRRTMTYHMTKSMGSEKPVDSVLITNAIRFKFISLALSISTAYEHPPASLAMVLYNIFRGNINKVTAGILYDVTSTRLQSIGATTTMAIRCGVKPWKLCSAIYAASPALVHMPEYGRPYIRSFKNATRRLTEHGKAVVAGKKDANVPDIERVMERMYVLRPER